MPTEKWAYKLRKLPRQPNTSLIYNINTNTLTLIYTSFYFLNENIQLNFSKLINTDRIIVKKFFDLIYKINITIQLLTLNKDQLIVLNINTTANTYAYAIYTIYKKKEMSLIMNYVDRIKSLLLFHIAGDMNDE